jgi:hypothetical protein
VLADSLRDRAQVALAIALEALGDMPSSEA